MGNGGALTDDGGSSGPAAWWSGDVGSITAGRQEAGGTTFRIGMHTSTGRDDARVRVASGKPLRSVNIALQSGGPIGNLLSCESLDYDHRAATDWTQPGRNRVSRRWTRTGLRQRSEELLALSQLRPPSPVGQEAEKANANEALGQHMQQEPPQELVGGDGHFPLLAAVGVVLPPKGDLAIGQLDKAVVGNSYPVCVSRQIMEHMLRAAEGRLGIDHPIPAEQFPQECSEGPFRLQRFETAGKEKVSFSKSALQTRHELAAENTTEYLYRQEEGVAPRMDPPLAVWGKTAGGNHTVNMRMVLEVLPPRMEHTEETDLCPQVFGIGCNLQLVSGG
jgi:hypothetical protein